MGTGPSELILRKELFIKKGNRKLKCFLLCRNIFFELFLGDLDEKITSAGYRRKRNKKESETVRRADNLFNL